MNANILEKPGKVFSWPQWGHICYAGWLRQSQLHQRVYRTIGWNRLHDGTAFVAGDVRFIAPEHRKDASAAVRVTGELVGDYWIFVSIVRLISFVHEADYRPARSASVEGCSVFRPARFRWQNWSWHNPA
jgi:hypothetical protein